MSIYILYIQSSSGNDSFILPFEYETVKNITPLVGNALTHAAPRPLYSVLTPSVLAIPCIYAQNLVYLNPINPSTPLTLVSSHAQHSASES